MSKTYGIFHVRQPFEKVHCASPVKIINDFYWCVPPTAYGIREKPVIARFIDFNKRFFET